MHMHFCLYKPGEHPILVKAPVDTTRVEQLVKEGYVVKDSWVVE